MPSVKFEKITKTESWRVFDEAAQRQLGMSGTEFARRWDAGEFRDSDDVTTMRVALLRPSGRHVSR